MTIAAAAPARPAAAQGATGRGPAPSRSWLEATSGGVVEEYLRALQLDTARSRPYPQTVRGFGPSELARMLRPGAAHPWAAAYGPAPARRASAPHASARRVSALVLRPAARAFGNTTYPFGVNDGPVWAGRGLTVAVDAGAALVAGPLSVRVQPVLLWAQNASFPLADDSRPAETRFRNAAEPGNIDLPQRFGNGPVYRLDLGETEIRVDAWGLAAGVSNASQSWGPATTHPLILGTNAPGFLHVFVGTSRPLPIGIGRLHGRLVAGELAQTAWSPAPDSLARRAGTGIVLTFTPRGVPGLELGATRFFHRRWADGTIPWSALTAPLTGILLKRNVLDVDDTTSTRFVSDNQLASVFARWAFAAGVEVYGEFARNDAALDVRELLVEPDHQSAYMLGLRRLLGARGGRLRVARVEWVNSRHTHIDRVRPQGAFYSHGVFTQGHTNRGELLASVAVPGGGGAVVGFDQYDARGRTSIELHRIGRAVPVGEGAPTPRDVDVQYAAGYQRTRFLRGYDLTTGANLSWELNRDFRRDAANLNLVLGLRWGGAPVADAPR